ncbi:hypothetical protein ILUMI_07907 [Ignelater luminosus]|uniref:Uncharacterized protein n=1 Tax=Ignelater luminosus TaxID=2038154 RepID=A0A8K0D7C1_IGNLU|nr:hypothetical protein ILUMI_07907 [Ignelater luminosus]
MFEEPTRIRINQKLIASPKKKTLPKSVFKDGVKRTLIPAKIILDSLGLWPEELIKIYIILIFVASFITFIGNAQYVQHNKNLTRIVSAITVSTSTVLSDAIFQSGWHLLQDNVEFKKSLLMMIIRSQKEVHLTAAGFSILKLPTFLKERSGMAALDQVEEGCFTLTWK